MQIPCYVSNLQAQKLGLKCGDLITRVFPCQRGRTLGSGTVWPFAPTIRQNLRTVILLAAACVGSRASTRNICILESGIGNCRQTPLLAIRSVELCNWDRNNLVLSCVSRGQYENQILQTDRRMLSQPPLVSVADPRRKDKQSKLPLGLLSVIGGNIATAIAFPVSPERYASKMAQQQRGLFECRTSQSLIEALLLGLAATILLLILEVSLWHLFKSA